MKIARRPAVLVILCGAALTACAPLGAPGPGQGSDIAGPTDAVRERVSGRFVELIGAKAQHAPPYLGTPGTNFYCLRSFIDRATDETADQLYVADSYDGKARDWDAAFDASGHVLRVVPISRMQIGCDRGGCSYAEEFAADIPARDLRASPQGFSVTFADRVGDRKTINVSAAQVAAQLAAVAAQHQPLQAPVASDEPGAAAAHQP